MFCTKCGKELFDEAVMCPQCGTPTINAQIPAQEIEQQKEPSAPTRTPDVKILYHIGEIGEKFPMKLNIELGDFYFENNCLILESFSSAARVKTGEIRVNYSDIQIKKLTSKYMFNKFKVIVFNTGGFVFSVYAQDGFMGKQVDSLLSSSKEGSPSEFNATISKLEKLENLLNLKIGGM